MMITMTFTLLFLALAAEDPCITCHLKLEDNRLSTPARGVAEDVHTASGFSCASCHGGDPQASIGRAPGGRVDHGRGFIGKPAPQAIPALCGKCHADAALMHRYDPNLPVDQLAQYRTSVHGQKLAAGAKDVAQCVSCHGVHGILSPKDPRSPVYATRIPETCGRCHANAEHMKAYDVPTDQLDLYRSSVHGKALFEKGDLGAPTCNSCHGNHGAAPPEVSSVSLVCGTCHTVQKELFAASAHKPIFDEAGQPECETCHGNHGVASATDELLGVEKGSICVECHDSARSPAYQTAKALRGDIERLKNALAGARTVMDVADRAGMDVSEAEMTLIDANQALVESRNLVHAASLEKLSESVEKGSKLAAKAEQAGRARLAELQYRRKGLALSLVFIFLVVIGLHLKIRQIEGHPTHSRSRNHGYP